MEIKFFAHQFSLQHVQFTTIIVAVCLSRSISTISDQNKTNVIQLPRKLRPTISYEITCLHFIFDVISSEEVGLETKC